ncbi:YhdP family protein [Veronia pacifica]|uniref:TIGR02099 family protein n=1 Tax=Veronia pacifica TaxID=1080227 RepID=A0A1C3ELM6_9GAMM|nr:YhdP family protein [Veronia pacifica]ODA34134.1 TIGR02099 family protein [Veronia pacifica]
MMRFFLRFMTAFTLTLLLLVATATVSLRLLLPNINTFKGPIQEWIQQKSDFQVDFESATGHWRYLVPSLSLQQVTLASQTQKQVMSLAKLDLQLDLLASIKNLEPVFSRLNADGLKVDLTQLSSNSVKSGDKSKDDANREDVIHRLEKLFLVNITKFGLRNAVVTLRAPDDNDYTLDIDSLLWRNQGQSHRAQGTVSVRGTNLNKLEVNLEFSEQGTLSSLTGKLYIGAENISVRPFISPYLPENIVLEQATAGGRLWADINGGRLTGAQFGFDRGRLAWSEKNNGQHSIGINGGTIHISPEREGWRLDSESLSVQTDGKRWPEPKIHAELIEHKWRVNLSDSQIGLIMPVSRLLPLSPAVGNALRDLNPNGKVSDLRVSYEQGSPLQYSARVEDVSFRHWTYLPDTKGLAIDLSGVGSAGKARLVMSEQTLPYGEFFQAPLDIQQGDVSLYWQQGSQQFHIWSDHVSVSSSVMGVKGQFRLDLPQKGSPWLSFYTEASLKDVSKTWRYLPTLALGKNLTTFLSDALKSGRVDKAKLVWHGTLADFPYNHHDGMFQAAVPLRRGTFKFLSSWPQVSDIDANLLFENDRLLIDANNARIGGIRSDKILGNILLEDGQPLKLDIKAKGESEAATALLMDTPLADSVGSALTHLGAKGPVAAGLSLTIPFDGSEPTTQGAVIFDNNQINLQAPKLQLNSVSGQVLFQDDKVSSDQLNAVLLDQRVDIGVNGEQQEQGYLLNIKTEGDWDIKKLLEQTDLGRFDKVAGTSRWDLRLGLGLYPESTRFRADLNAQLGELKSDLPEPFSQSQLAGRTAKVIVEGSDNQFTVYAQLPDSRYRGVVSLTGKRPRVMSSFLEVGESPMPVSTIGSHLIDVNYPYINLDDWKVVAESLTQTDFMNQSGSVDIPAPTGINLRSDKLTMFGFTLNNVSVAARNNEHNWHIIYGSEEVDGDAVWQKDSSLTVSVDHLFINYEPDNSKEEKLAHNVDEIKDEVSSLATDADKMAIKYFPDTLLAVNELWLQGYRVGKLDAKLINDNNRISLTKFSVGSGENSIVANGWWEVDDKGISHSWLKFNTKGANTADIIGRFGVTGGIQEASYSSFGDVTFDGAPWRIDTRTLNGDISATLEDGYISGVGGAGKLLGLFSLDSIVRKMQLDFRGVFEDGLAFDEISGRGVITDGVVVTDNIQMKALAGDMFIKGIANIPKNTVDADVRFIPDITSSIPVLSAFAVAPQTALYVAAVTTVLSPVVDVFTQIRYQVSGRLDAPEIKEVSRSQSEMTLPPKALERLRGQQQGSGQ